jgi:hypothetical protein
MSSSPFFPILSLTVFLPAASLLITLSLLVFLPTASLLITLSLPVFLPGVSLLITFSLLVACRASLLLIGLGRGRSLHVFAALVLRLLALAILGTLLVRRRLPDILLLRPRLRLFLSAPLSCRCSSIDLFEMLAHYLVARLITIILSA